MLAGSEEPFVTLVPWDGWSLCPYPGPEQEGGTLCSQTGACPQEITLQAPLHVGGQRGPARNPSVGRLLGPSGVYDWQGDMCGEDSAWEGGHLFWRVSVVRARKDKCSVTVSPPVLPCLASGIQATTRR